MNAPMTAPRAASAAATMTPNPIFAGLTQQPPDGLLALIKAYNDDPRAEKIDLGVGVYRTEAGDTPVFRAVKTAEQILLQEQRSKGYLGPEGDLRFLELLQPLIFGPRADEDLVAVQTPGGTGALRLAAALVNLGRPAATVWLGTPSWPNHAPIFTASGLRVATFRHLDPETQGVDYEGLIAALDQAAPGDLVVLHGCCHNPTGADLDATQWAAVAARLADRGLTPLIDLAYQGLAQGIDPDAAGLRSVMRQVPDVLVAYSCDKNFGLYRERTGALFARAHGLTSVVNSNILQLARGAWSMPPDHGAATVRLVLESSDLTADWTAELNGMRQRLTEVRTALASADSRLEPLRRQFGLFSNLPLSPNQVEAMRRDHAVYMAGSGRINIAGLNTHSIPTFVKAFQTVVGG